MKVLLHTAMSLQAFAENVLVCGGGSAVTGLGAAIVAEMQSVSTPSLQPALCSSPDYMPEHTLKHSSWMGAAILSKVRSIKADTSLHVKVGAKASVLFTTEPRMLDRFCVLSFLQPILNSCTLACRWCSSKINTSPSWTTMRLDLQWFIKSVADQLLVLL